MDEVAIATVRTLSVDAVQRTQSMRTFAFAPLEDFEGKCGSTPAAIADAARGMPAGGAAA